MPAVRSVAILVAAFAAAALLAACTAHAPPASVNPPSVPKAPVTPTAPVAAPSASTSPATAAPATSAPVATASATPPATASAPSTPSPFSSGVAVATNGCATMTQSLPVASITVCPDQAPVGGTVHITIKGCAGSEDFPAAGLYFLGPDSWLGTDGGGGKNVPYSPETGSREATATFVIPASYTGGNENGPYPTLLTRPGRYVFITDPAGECYVPFTVTAG
jgi:hypothetical protein